MNRYLSNVRLLLKFLWPPLRNSGIPFAVIVIAFIALFAWRSHPSKASLLRRYLGVTNAAVFQVAKARYQSLGTVEWDVWIFLRGSREQVKSLLVTQGLEETARGSLRSPRHFGIQDAPEMEEVGSQFFRRRSNPSVDEYAIVDSTGTQLWFIASHY
jgi:hypothetical protein